MLISVALPVNVRLLSATPSPTAKVNPVVSVKLITPLLTAKVTSNCVLSLSATVIPVIAKLSSSAIVCAAGIVIVGGLLTEETEILITSLSTKAPPAPVLPESL